MRQRRENAPGGTDMLISHNREKLINAIIYFCKETSCNKLKLYKLLYHLDFRHYAQTGRSVTGLEYFAWPMGPVPVELQDEIKSPREDLKEKVEFSFPPLMGPSQAVEITPKAEFDPSVFTKREMALLKEVADEFALSYADEMIYSTHLPGNPWDRVFNQEGRKQKKIPFEYALSGEDAEEVKEAAIEHEEMLKNYA
jgi:uncharacterized phage-associated protein